MEAPRFELSPTSRFADRASDYARFRPSYPAEAIDAALAGMPIASGLVAADIGAGTGISSRLFAERGVRVLAVEPNAAMRESAEPHEGVTFVDGTAEATGLESASVDLVICAQAFHWFRPVEALAEFRRIVKPGGRLVTLDGVFEPGQNPVARWLISRDRGRHVRTRSQYQALYARVFATPRIEIQHRTWLPYTYCLAECTRPLS